MGKKVSTAKKVFKSNKPTKKTVLSAKEVADRLRARKAARLMEGAGDDSQATRGPKAKNKKGRDETGFMKEAISDKDKENLARSNAARGSYKRSLTLKKNSMEELADTYDKMLKGRQRAERLKKNSRFLPLFKKRGYANLAKKAGGPVIKRKAGQRIGTPKVKKIMPDDSFMKGLSQDALDDILGRPKRDAAGVKRSSKKKKGNTKVALKIKKIPEGPRRPDLGATFRKGGKGGSKSKSKKRFIRKSGGPVVKKMGGGSLKDIPAGNKGLPNLPTATRNTMGYKKAGGIVKRKASGKVIKSSTSGQDLVNSCYD
tara:strand:+ start:106 stop:1047 length:942 start_codon:yes stop_codon:yes gene_type:complete